MEALEVTAYLLHTIFAGIWTGAVVFVAVGILPQARDGNLNATPLAAIGGSLRTISRASAAILFVTGSYMAAIVHTSETLTRTTDGQLVLAMLGLWFVLAGSVEMGVRRLVAGTERDKVREPARTARGLFLVAAVVALALLGVAGLLSARSSGVL